MGRPKKQIDFEAIRELASENNSVSDICRAIKIARQTFYNSKKAQEAYEDGRADMRINLNHWQWQAARNNPQMQIHLGKYILEQNDMQEPEKEKHSNIILKENGDIEVE